LSAAPRTLRLSRCRKRERRRSGRWRQSGAAQCWAGDTPRARDIPYATAQLSTTHAIAAPRPVGR
jgi:hypothetical protein